MKHSVLVVMVAALAFGACGDDGDPAALFDAAPDPVDADLAAACTSTGGSGGTHKLFLNFESQELMPGAQDATQNTTFMVSETLTSPPYFDGVATRDTIITRVVDNVTSLLAPFDIEVVTTRPAAGPYTMMVLGGSGTDLGIGNANALAANTCLQNTENMLHLITDVRYQTAIHRIIGAFALGQGLSVSKTNGSCLCWNHADCEPESGTVCTLSDDVEIEIDPEISCDDASVLTMNAHQKFKNRFGCRP